MVFAETVTYLSQWFECNCLGTLITGMTLTVGQGDVAMLINLLFFAEAEFY